MSGLVDNIQEDKPLICLRQALTWRVVKEKKRLFIHILWIKQGLSSWQISGIEWKKKNWEDQCALISHTMLSKTNMFNFI